MIASSMDEHNINQTTMERRVPPTPNEMVSSDEPNTENALAPSGESSVPSTPSGQATSDESNNAPSAPESWEDILGSGKLKKMVLSAGKGVESRPRIGAMITATWQATFVGDTAVEELTQKFILGDGDVAQVYDLTCALMQEGEKAKVLCHPQFYYGEKGWPQKNISPNASAEVLLTLDQVHDIPDFATMPISERLDLGMMKRQRGNWLYARGERHLAISVWMKALNVLDLEKGSGGQDVAPEVLQEVLESRAKILANMAAAQIQMEAYDAAIRSAQEAISLQPGYFKAYFRLGKAYSHKGNHEDAIRVMQKALQCDPDQSRIMMKTNDWQMIHDELARLTKRVKDEKESQKNLYSRMFGLQNSKQTSANKDKPENTSASPSAQDQKGADKTPKPKEKKGFKVSKWMWATGGIALAAAVGVGLYKFFSH